MKRRLFGVVCCVLCMTGLGFAQENKKCPRLPKWGKLAPELLAMTQCEEAPEADAVILLDAVDVKIVLGNRLHIEFNHRVRIKILTENGKDHADIRIPFWHEDKLRNLKAHTLLPNGKKIKLNKHSIYDEQNNKWKFKVFTMPGVTPSAVIEYKYRKTSEHFGNLEPWAFQNGLYTLQSQISVLVPPGFIYRAFKKNIGAQEIEEYKEEKVAANTRQYPMLYTWRMAQVPALEKVPYIINLDDYRKEISFQIVGYQDQYESVTFIKEWKDIAEMVRHFRKRHLKKNKTLTAAATRLTVDCHTVPEKVGAIYNYVRTHILNDVYAGLISDEMRKPLEVIKAKKGSRVEKNWLAMALLDAVNVPCCPVLISTRSHGRVDEFWPRLSQFNRIIVGYGPPRNMKLFDASYTEVPMGLLPAQDACGLGFVVSEDMEQMITIPTSRKANMSYANTLVKLDADGHLVGESTLRFEDYRGIAVRARVKADGADTFVESLLESRFAELSIDSVRVEHLEQVDLPLVLRVMFSARNEWQQTGDMAYFSPSIYHCQEENPFIRETRELPIEFNYRITNNETVQWVLPQGFMAEELPRASRMNNKQFRYSSSCSLEKQTVLFNRYFQLQGDLYPAASYMHFKDGYEQIVTGDQRQVVVRKVTAGADND